MPLILWAGSSKEVLLQLRRCPMALFASNRTKNHLFQIINEHRPTLVPHILPYIKFSVRSGPGREEKIDRAPRITLGSSGL